ncbi:hypothetical protein LEP1GSC039_1814 [Leptospira santarosai str. 2000027870]|nr:hypothetical protein LEP1GSC039_1814 [Leptospira santarosai str. 2000027870]
MKQARLKTKLRALYYIAPSELTFTDVCVIDCLGFADELSFRDEIFDNLLYDPQ